MAEKKSGTAVTERRGRWAKRDQAAFFQRLAMSGDVEAAARSVGRSVAGAMIKRRDDGAFRDTWDAAIEEAREQVRTQLIAHVLNARAAGEGDPDFDVDRAFKLIGLRGGSPAPTPAAGGAASATVPIETVERMLLKKLRALRRKGPAR